jgi:hypothetical protein
VLCTDWLSRYYHKLKNPRAALTLPGGDLIVAIVKHDQNSNSTRLTMPRRRPLWPMWAKPLRGLPCLPSNDYYQWPATIIFVLIYYYHNILINVKKKYYMLYIHLLIGNCKLPLNRNGIVKNERFLTNYSEIVHYGFIRSILCLLLNLKPIFRGFFRLSGAKS